MKFETFKINGLWVLTLDGNFVCSLIGMKRQPKDKTKATSLLMKLYGERKVSHG